MNPNREENEIRELFRELRREDERLAPTFARDWAAALSRSEQVRPRRRIFLVPVAASILLILLGGFAFIFFRRPSMQTVLTATQEFPAAVVQAPPPVSLPGTAASPPPHISKTGRRKVTPQRLGTGYVKERMSRRPPREPPSAILISSWRSPTDFLLESSAEQLLKTVPRLNELPIEIKPIGSDEHNRRKNRK